MSYYSYALFIFHYILLYLIKAWNFT